MADAQFAIDLMRQFLSEPDKNNSRFNADESELLRYYNLGRKSFARQSQAVKAMFERTTTVGATPGNSLARYVLDPKVLTIDWVTWKNFPVDPAQDSTAWNAKFNPDRPAEQGIPFMYRTFGDALDLYFAPNDAQTLVIAASSIPEDLVALDSPENRLKDDQVTAAARWGVGRALYDDDRDGSVDMAEFAGIVKFYEKLQNKRGPRYVASPSKGTRRDVTAVYRG